MNLAAVRLAQAPQAICLWLSCVRAKQGMLLLLADEVRSYLTYGVFRRLVAEWRLAFNIFDALPLHKVAAAYT